MRRFLVALLIAVLVPFAARAADSGAPSVVVYPFSPNGGTIEREAPARLATLIATQVAEGGKVGVKAPPAVIDRKDYLTTARALGVDYYLSGFITPLGDGVTVVEQLVSTATGIVIYADTANLTTYNDAQGLGDQIRTAILAHSRRNLPVEAPTPAPQQNPTPQAQASGREANIGGLFKRKKSTAAATAAPSAQPTNVPATALKIAATATPAATAVARATAPPAAPRPAPTTAPAAATTAPVTPAPAAAAKTVAAAGVSPFALTAITGDADATLRDEAAQRVLADFTAAHRETSRADAAAAACAAGAAGTLSGMLTAAADKNFGGSSATFDFVVRDCNGKQLYRRTSSADAGGADSARTAALRAVDAAVGAYLNPPRRR